MQIKKIMGLFVIVTAISASLTTYAATYDVGNFASSDLAEGKETVLIKRGESTADVTNDSIVYINQAATTFDAQTQFMLKSSAKTQEGLYTVMLGSSTGSVVYDTFYIGMSNTVGDEPMTAISEENGGIAEIEDADGIKTYNIGYTATVSGSFRSVIIKAVVDDEDVYMGRNLETNISGDGSVTLGIQINGVPTKDTIKGVWLSPRTIDGSTAGKAPSVLNE